jgi:feruloyl esterase
VRTYSLANTQSFYRFYLVPGLAHCRGGYGPIDVDAMTTLIDWVEGGTAPERLPAQLTKDGKLKYQRAYCAYPQATRYNGSGDTEDAKNYTCQQTFRAMTQRR